MKKMMFAAAAGALALFGASAASADSFTPTGNHTFSGPVVVNYTITLACTMNATARAFTSGGGTDGEISAANLTGGLLCGVVGFINLPWNVDVSAPASPVGATATKLKIKAATARTTTGTVCGPEDLEVNWTAGSPPSITFPVGTELNPPTPGCKISGTLTQTSTPYLVITK